MNWCIESLPKCHHSHQHRAFFLFLQFLTKLKKLIQRMSLWYFNETTSFPYTWINLLFVSIKHTSKVFLNFENNLSISFRNLIVCIAEHTFFLFVLHKQGRLSFLFYFFILSNRHFIKRMKHIATVLLGSNET